jgi:uncharacterized protein
MSHPAIRYLVLWLTTGCNLHCRYCYRKSEDTSAMSEETAEQALGLAAASGVPFHVQLAGGEPALEPGLIEFVACTVRSNRWPATIAVQTNATLVNRHFIDLCSRYHIEVGVSVDGPPDIQEKLRGGAGATFRGLALLDQAKIPVRVTTVLSSVNVGRLYDLVVALARFSNVRGIGLDPLVMSGGATGAVDLLPSLEAVTSGTRHFLTAMGLVNRTYGVGVQWRELEAVRKALSPGGPSRHYCHACTGESLGVHPDGTLYPCSQAIGDPAMTVGTVERVEWDRLKELFYTNRLSGECDTCRLAGRCPGDCPSRLYYNGDVASAMCAIYRCTAELLMAQEEAKTARAT